MTRIIAGLLVLSLTSFSVKAAGTNYTTSTQTNAQPKFALCLAGVAVAAGFVVYAVYRCVQIAGLTNSPPPPGNTNINSGANTFYAPSVVKFDFLLVTNNDSAVEVKQDISSRGWTDWQGNPYTWFFSTQTDTNGPHVQTSTNLTNWENANYTVNIWLSSSVSPDPDLLHLTNIVSVQYDNNGIPLLTNMAPITPNIPINAGVRVTAPQMYFRGVYP